MAKLRLAMIISLICLNLDLGAKPKFKYLLKNQILIESDAQASKKFLAELKIPLDSNLMILRFNEDEMIDKPLEYIYIQKNKKYFSPSGSESRINNEVETYNTVKDPTLAIDRIYDQKHVITRIIYFPKTKIFGEKIEYKKKDQYSLIMKWQDGQKANFKLNFFQEIALPGKKPKVKKQKPQKQMMPNQTMQNQPVPNNQAAPGLEPSASQALNPMTIPQMEQDYQEDLKSIQDVKMNLQMEMMQDMQNDEGGDDLGL